MLTEAVSTQHQPRRLEEGRHAAENGRECKRKREESLLSEWGGGGGGGVMGFCTIRPQIHRPVEITQSGNQSPTQTPQ